MYSVYSFNMLRCNLMLLSDRKFGIKVASASTWKCLWINNAEIHTYIILTAFPVKGCRGSGANPSCYRAQSRVRPWTDRQWGTGLTQFFRAKITKWTLWWDRNLLFCHLQNNYLSYGQIKPQTPCLTWNAQNYLNVLCYLNIRTKTRSMLHISILLINI